MTRLGTNDGRFGERVSTPMDRSKAIVRAMRDERATPAARVAVVAGAKGAVPIVRTEPKSLGWVCEPMN